jgi:glycerol-3-phosphate cytidylyltransferase
MVEGKKSIGIIAGNFDIIHPGYVRLFHDAKAVCDHLIIALQTDSSIERPEKLKPVLSIEERKEILLALIYIDEILTYTTEEELFNLIRECAPDIRIIGTDYIDRDFTGKELTKDIHYHKRDHDWSTTRFKKEIAKSLER